MVPLCRDTHWYPSVGELSGAQMSVRELSGVSARELSGVSARELSGVNLSESLVVSDCQRA